MKKVVPFIFPVAALAIIVLLIIRWYSINTARSGGEISQTGEGVEIEDLSTQDQERIMKGSGDFKTTDLKGPDNTTGKVRYEIKDNKVSFSVMADLPELTEGRYQVWLKPKGSEQFAKAFVLTISKGGAQGSAGLGTDKLPLEVVVSKETTDDDKMETEVLKGTIAE